MKSEELKVLDERMEKVLSFIKKEDEVLAIIEDFFGKKLGDLIHDVRILSDLSIDEFAKVIGTTSNFLKNIEAGNVAMPANTAKLLAKSLQKVHDLKIRKRWKLEIETAKKPSYV